MPPTTLSRRWLEGGLNGLQQLCLREGFEQAIDGTLLDEPRAHALIGIGQ